MAATSYKVVFPCDHFPLLSLPPLSPLFLSSYHPFPSFLPPTLSSSLPLSQAYSIALQLFDMALSVSEGVSSRLLAMLCPPDSHPDDNPVFVICRSDNCSFTWTGEMHIHQVGREEEEEVERGGHQVYMSNQVNRTL